MFLHPFVCPQGVGGGVGEGCLHPGGGGALVLTFWYIWPSGTSLLAYFPEAMILSYGHPFPPADTTVGSCAESA